MLDSGLLLYFGLCFLFVHRLITWRICGAWFRYANYWSLLFGGIGLLLCYTTAILVHRAGFRDNGSEYLREDFPRWMLKFMAFAPVCTWLTFVSCFAQTCEHVVQIRNGSAPLKHDRAVQVIALPAVYSCMALSSMLRLYDMLLQESPPVNATISSVDDASSLWSSVLRPFQDPVVSTPSENDQLSMSKSETCFWVGDLYEAWALYQFAKLTLELIRFSVTKQEKQFPDDQRLVAKALTKAHSAVESLAWMGILLFLVVCVAQASWALWILSLSKGGSYEAYVLGMSQFHAAGTVASAAAMYNVHIVESTFHHHLEHYNPVMKFITVKILVSFAFFQKGGYQMLVAIQKTLPGVAQSLIHKVPFFGEILLFSDFTFELFYSVLLTYECLFVALMHWYAWSSTEEWYNEDDDGEHKPLTGSSA